MDILTQLAAWFSDPANWQGAGGIPNRTLQHVGYSLTATLVAALLALPLGAYIGHTNRGATLAINLSNIGRAIPTFGIIILAFTLAGLGVTPVVVALVALAIPPIVTNTYAGVRAVDPEIRDSAFGMGLTGSEVLRQVEVPVAMPLIMAGLRTSAVQVVATATLAAFIGSGGLGRFIFDGLANRDLPPVIGGALLVAGLALLTEWALSRLQRVVTPRGLRQREELAAVEAAHAEPA